jgi:ribonucleotide monophosphatase NagD (HAD superfamily)
VLLLNTCRNNASKGEFFHTEPYVEMMTDPLMVTRPYILLSSSAKEEVSSVMGVVNDEAYDSSYDSVVVGLAPEVFDYSHINTAFRILKGEQNVEPNVSYGLRESINKSMSSPFLPPPLIATHKAKYVQTEIPAGLSLGPGPFITALETAANVQAHVLGKPTKLFFETVIDDFYLSGELDKGEHNGRIVIIGDDVETDLGDGAIELGLWRILGKWPLCVFCFLGLHFRNVLTVWCVDLTS